MAAMPNKLPDLPALKYRAISDAAADLGGVAAIRTAFIGLQQYLYSPPPQLNPGIPPSASR